VGERAHIDQFWLILHVLGGEQRRGADGNGGDGLRKMDRADEQGLAMNLPDGGAVDRPAFNSSVH
jgi:hypothetical protein